MTILVETETGNIIKENDQVKNPDGTLGRYTGHMPGHARNDQGLIYVANGKEWEDCYLPENAGYKLVEI